MSPGLAKVLIISMQLSMRAYMDLEASVVSLSISKDYVKANVEWKRPEVADERSEEDGSIDNEQNAKKK